MKIYLIRHGGTVGNQQKRYVGSTDEPLTEESAQTLRKNRACYPQAEAVFISPLQRCRQTADILYPKAKKQVLPDLREIDFGAFEYKNAEDLRDDPHYQAWVDSGGREAFPEGESREAFCGRCAAAFEKACAETEEPGAAFVVHGGTIMAILDAFSDPHRDYYEWQIGNGEGFSCETAWEKTPAGPVLHLRSISPLPQTPALTGIEDTTVCQRQNSLRCGYTTGSCAAAAAQTAAEMLLSGRLCHRADLLTPKGIRLHLPVQEQEITKTYASCAVRKYAGDDPDVTDGALIYARVEYACGTTAGSATSALAGRAASSTLAGRKENASQREAPAASGRFEGSKPDPGDPGGLRIIIDGGIGVGRVTKPGLEQSVGTAAINRVPREMIESEVREVCEAYEYTGSLKVTISVPAGEEIAKRTFNPHLGIEGGISILGTSGIVEPMSEKALIESIRVEVRQKAANHEEYLLVTPGSYGEAFIRSVEGKNQTDSPDVKKDLPNGQAEGIAALDAEDAVKCSNFVQETLDAAVEYGVKGILFVAHIGKFIKVSGGIMNTHSSQADCRAELMAAQAMRGGAPEAVVRRILSTNTTEEAVGILKESGHLKQTMEEVTRRVREQLQRHCRGAIETEAVLYSNQFGYLGETDGAEALAKKIAKQR